MPYSLKKRIIQLSAGLLLCLLLIAAGISAIGLRDQVVAADLAVVPGNTVEADGKPSARLRGRLNAAMQLYAMQKCKAILVSGGIDEAGHDEATVMKDYLVAHGVPATVVYTDNQGSNTFETARATAKLLREKGWESTILASQFFHVARLQLAMKKFGVKVAGHAHATYYEVRDVYSLAREVLAYFEYTFKNPAS